MQIVRVRNVGRNTFKAKFDNETYTIPAGDESIVPLGALVLWCGNPEARNVSARQRHRVQEFTRIRTKWGAYENEEKWQANKPQLEFFKMDGERIYTVADDPEGLHVTTLGATDDQNTATLTAKVSSLEGQLGELIGMIKSGKLVLSDDLATQEETRLEQMGADDMERSWGLTTDPSELPDLPPMVIPSESIDEPPYVEPNPLGNAPFAHVANVVGDGGADEIVTPEEAATSNPENDLPPVDAPQTVKVGGAKGKKPSQSAG